MNEIIKVNYENERPTVSGRELHEFLEVGSNYTTWFNRMTEYGFTENQDFQPIFQKWNTAQGNETTQMDHQLTIEMSKEIAMIQRNEKGKQARQYFIALEKQWNTPEAVMARALKMAETTIKTLQTTVIEQRPKVIFADAVSASKTSILVGDMAKLLKQNGVDMGASRFFSWLRDNGFLIKRKGTDWNMPTQKSMELQLFEIKETSIAHSDGHTSISRTPKITGKGQLYFINKFVGQEDERLEA
ncbi:MAG: oxidoreductase [Clostridia bacterium]|nr:oxidoreductase [Clostridia bacterium]